MGLQDYKLSLAGSKLPRIDVLNAIQLYLKFDTSFPANHNVSFIKGLMATKASKPNRPAHRGGRAEQELFSWSLLAALILLAALAAPFFAGDVYLGSDLGDFHLPARAFYAEQLARGESFDWMPSIFSGFYLTGEGQAGVYHPVHQLLYRILPLRAALGWEYLCSYPLMLAGMFFFLRRRLRRRDAAMIGSLVFTFSSSSLLHFVHPNAVAAAAHIPWLLGMIDIILVDANRRRVASAQMALALLTGSLLLLGCPQYFWFSLLVETGYTVFLVITRMYAPRDGCETMPTCQACIGCRRSSSSYVIVAKGLGMLLGALQLLPTLDALLGSTRQATDATELALGALHPLNLIQLVAPYLPVDRVFGGNVREFGLYAGAAPLMLALWVVVRRKQLGTLRPLAVAAGGLAIVALLLAMGNYGLIERLHHLLPGGGWFRFSCRYTVLFHFAVAVLAAIGFVLLEREARERQKFQRYLVPAGETHRAAALWKQYEAIGAVILISTAVAVAGLILRQTAVVASVPRVLVGPLLTITAGLLLIAASQGIRGALAAMILFSAADLGYYGLSYTLADPTAHPENLVALAVTPPSPTDPLRGCPALAASPTRVFAPPAYSNLSDSRIGNQMTLAGWRRTDGYAELEPRRQLNYFSLPALRVSSTQWVRRSPSTSAIEGLKPRRRHTPCAELPHTPCADYVEDWLEVPDPLPRVRLVTKVVASDNAVCDIERIDVARVALCDFSLALPPGKPGEAMIAQERPGHLAVNVRCSSPQMLVIAESFHEGWRCAVDGVPRRLYRINGDFMGCLVEPGNAEAVLDFRPESLHRGYLASLAGFALMLGCFISGTARRELRLVEKAGTRK